MTNKARIYTGVKTASSVYGAGKKTIQGECGGNCVGKRCPKLEHIKWRKEPGNKTEGRQ